MEKLKEGGGTNHIFTRDHKQSRFATVFPTNLDYHILEKYCDNNGRFLLLKCEFEEFVYVIVNCNAPTQKYKKDQIDFINLVNSHINKYENENIIMGGNFNFYMHPDLDKEINMTSQDNNPVFRKKKLILH